MTVMRCRVLVLAAASTHRNIPHGSTSCPVSLAVLAEVSGLVHIIVVVVTEFGVHAITSRARKYLVRFLEHLLLRVARVALLLF